MRASSGENSSLHIPKELGLADRLKIYQAIDFEHITAKEKKSICQEL